MKRASGKQAQNENLTVVSNKLMGNTFSRLCDYHFRKGEPLLPKGTILGIPPPPTSGIRPTAKQQVAHV